MLRFIRLYSIEILQHSEYPCIADFQNLFQVSVVTPWTMDPSVKYDAMVTFSSLEHSGLGRYGDGLNPWGDLIAMAR